MDNQELLWRQYSLSIDLFKHYLKLVVELNVFFYGITGGVVSYYLVHSGEPLMKYALLLPFAMSVCFSFLFAYGAYLMRFLRSEVFTIRNALGLKTAPELAVLTGFLNISAILMVIVAIGLAVMWCK
jgi:hypothetical protein